MTRKLQNDELNRLSVEKFKSIPKNPITLVLDNIRSMHNVGAIFRTSDAFAIEKIFLCGITATPPHRDIRKTALGADESMEWEYFEDAVALVKNLNKTHLVVALEQAESSVALREFMPDDRPIAIVVGNEVNGVQQEIIDICGTIIEIPQFGVKHSFNVSVSTGITLWEIFNKIHEK